MNMHVLIAGSAGSETRVERALRWALDSGATEVTRGATSSSVVALAGSGGSAVRFHDGDGHVRASLGLGAPATGDLDRGVVPGGTVAVDASESRVLVGSGEGNQRLFACSVDGVDLVSTHVGALIAALGSEAAVDRDYEDFLLGFGFYPDGRTPFRGVRALNRPGVFQLGRTDPLTVRASEVDPPDVDPTRDLAELVCEIVDEQAGDAKRVGVLLGGFDSALVAAALNRTGREVHTFTFNFSEPGFEQRNVDAAVTAANAQHHWVTFTPDRLFAALLDMPERLNQPSPQPHYQLQTIIAAEQARAAGMDIVFTGDGCDALFAAYPTINTRAAAHGSLERVPLPARRALLRLLALPPADRRLGHVARMGRSAVRASMLDGRAAHHLPSQYLDDVALARLRRDGPDQAETVDAIRHRLAEAAGAEGLHRLAVDGNAQTGQSQSKVEGAVARSGLAVVSPFTHPRFRSTVKALPEDRQRPSGGLRGAEGKPVLQEAAERSGMLSREVIYQRKQSPTEAPVDRWYSGPLRGDVLQLLGALPFETDTAYVENLLRPKLAEEMYRRKVAISQHALQAVGLLCSYAAFTRLAS